MNQSHLSDWENRLRAQRLADLKLLLVVMARAGIPMAKAALDKLARDEN
jgi:hypothetical protein